MKADLMFRTSIRMAAVILVFFSFQQAWAGIYQYRAEREFDLRNFQRALGFSQKGLAIQPRSLKLLYLQGRSAFSLAKPKQAPHYLKQAEESFKTLQKESPFFARPWIYSGLIDLEKKLPWKEAKKNLEKGLSLEPSSAWVLYTVGRAYLLRWSLLSKEEKNLTIDRIAESLAIHDPNQPSSYLDDALNLLWGQTQEFELIQKILPEDIFSYDRALLFSEKREIWKYREELFQKAQMLREKTYEFQCQRAEKELLRGYRERAFFEFQVASWVDNTRVYAQAGMLVSGFPRKWWPFKVETTLKTILEDQDEDWDFLMPRLAPMVEAYADQELKALYQKRREGLPPGEGEHEPALEDGDTIQDLSAELWWNQKNGNSPKLQGTESAGMPIFLKPGSSTISILMKSTPNSEEEYAYVRVRILEAVRGKIIGEVYADFRDFEERKFKLRTAGGKRWLQVDLMNGSSEISQEGPLLELGAVTIQSLS